MRVSLIVLVLLCVVTSNVYAGNLTPSPEAFKAAERYAEVSDLPAMLRSAVNNMAVSMPLDQAEIFKDFMNNSLDVKAFERLIVDAMVRHFTIAELNALADFYGSPEGRSILKKFGPYLADANQVITIFLKNAMINYVQQNSAPQ